MSLRQRLEVLWVMGLQLAFITTIGGLLVGTCCGITVLPFVLLMWAWTYFFPPGPPPSPPMCIEGVVVTDPGMEHHSYSKVDTVVLCGGGRIPGVPEVRDGLLTVTCSCPRAPGSKP